MSGKSKTRDPRGHSIRVYSEIYDSPAFRSLSPHDVMAYLALLRALKQYNNGDLSLPLTRAKTCGINHHLTLARSLRALCAVGLVAITRKGGCTKGGQRLPNLYRMTDRECYAMPKLHLEAMKETNEWKRFTSIELAHQAIAEAEKLAMDAHSKKISLGHAVTTTRTRRDVVGANTRTPCDTWNEGLGHGVTMAENPANPMPMRVTADFDQPPEKAGHRTPHVSPIQCCQPTRVSVSACDPGRYRRLVPIQPDLLVRLIHPECKPTTRKGMLNRQRQVPGLATASPNHETSVVPELDRVRPRHPKPAQPVTEANAEIWVDRDDCESGAEDHEDVFAWAD